MAGDDVDDFNRLYERLVVRRASKKRRGKRVEAAPAEKNWEEEARREEDRRKKQQQDAKVWETVRRLRLARNLRGVARSSGCSAQRLAFQLCDCGEQSERLLEHYRKAKGQRSRRGLQLNNSVSLEQIAASLYHRRAADFRPDAATTLEGKRRVMDELLFFSPPQSLFQSQIGYAERGNVVPPPPPRSNRKYLPGGD